jgi:hypothetical protein
MTIVQCTDVGWKVQEFGGGSNEPVEPTGGDDEEDDDADNSVSTDNRKRTYKAQSEKAQRTPGPNPV